MYTYMYMCVYMCINMSPGEKLTYSLKYNEFPAEYIQ